MNLFTLTLNVAVDQTITVDKLTLGAVHRARSASYAAGGKGVNAAACLADWGLPVAACGFLGRENAAFFEDFLSEKKVEDRFVRVDGASRTNVKLVDGDDTTDINLPGIKVGRAALAALDGILDDFAARGAMFPGLAALSGSLPTGCPEDIYARQVKKLTQAGFRVILDASGPALRAALAAPILPFCIKPNRHEIEEWAGRKLEGPGMVLEAARGLRRRGVALVVVSLGREGAWFVAEEGALLAWAEAPNIVSTVGAGDAMVAGIAAALAEGASLERIARLSTAFSLGKLGRIGSGLPDRETLEGFAGRVELRPASALDPI
ncbi:MAG: 1-phosphofructokinase [Candidatus Accumulibacter sp.]|jgi:1-phosphofructokinase|nr:1-phosphofructokinase [Accumulibacter sp.]